MFGCKSSRIRAVNAAGVAVLLSASMDPSENLFYAMKRIHDHVHDVGIFSKPVGADLDFIDHFLALRNHEAEEQDSARDGVYEAVLRMERQLAELPPIVLPPPPPPSPQPLQNLPMRLEMELEPELPFLRRSRRVDVLKRKRQLLANK
jgi:hypothetical protein